jgi:outer membrane protein OmpA-like peptidoglycan-associated protein
MKNKTITPALICLNAALVTAMAQDAAGSADHQLIKRVEGSEIFFTSKSDYDKLKLALEKIVWSSQDMATKPYKSLTVEGKRLTNYYLLPERVSVLEAFRNYEQELREQGFEILFLGEGEEVETPSYGNQIAKEILNMRGVYTTPEEKAQWPFQETNERFAAYIAARKSGENGDVFVSVYLVKNTHDKWLGGKLPIDRTLVRLDVCEQKKREQRMALVKSEEMAGEIALNGKVALYGILFEYDKATITPDSEPTLAEIAKLLNEKPDLKVLVVGHTDATGSFDYNLKLSQRRAESVVENLAGRGVSRERLFPVGVSFACPVATNATEDGRAKNRRVELVDFASARK